MITDTMDMSAPVTRGELREELDRAFEQRLEPLVTKEYLEQRLEPLVTKEYLEQRLEAFATKKDLELFATKKDLELFATKKDLETWGGALLEEIKKRLAEGLKEGFNEIKEALTAEFKKHVKSMEESFGDQVSVFDDKYKGLPERVKRLEGAVFPNDKSDDEKERPADTKAQPEEKKAKARPTARSLTPARSPKRR